MPDPFDNPEEHRRLLANVLLGDRIAERELVDLLSPIIKHAVRSAKHRGKNVPPDLREDFGQEVWAHLKNSNWHVLQQRNGEGSFLGFVWVVAFNKTRDLLAALLRRREVPIEEAPESADPDPDPELNAEMMQLAECIRRARQTLTPRHQEFIRVRHDLDLMYREIAERLNVPLGTVAGTLHRAENNLCNALRETCPDYLSAFGITFGQDE
jgi:RNA polymerase sigma factor (sigma-70 family)